MVIEDRFQDGVFDIIVFFGDVGIKFWVLIGDKVEMVINIGFFCNFLYNDMDFFCIQVNEDESGMFLEEDYLVYVEE